MKYTCATAPVYGVPFNQCWTSNVRTFRIGNVQSWRLTYTDSKSELAIGLYRLVAGAWRRRLEPGLELGRGGLAAEPRMRSRTSPAAPAAGPIPPAGPAITT